VKGWVVDWVVEIDSDLVVDDASLVATIGAMSWCLAARMQALVC
jgi:hypothetical protein